MHRPPPSPASRRAGRLAVVALLTAMGLTACERTPDVTAPSPGSPLLSTVPGTAGRMDPNALSMLAAAATCPPGGVASSVSADGAFGRGGFAVAAGPATSTTGVAMYDAGLPPGATSATAVDINNAGVMAANALVAGDTAAFVWSQLGGFQQIPALGAAAAMVATDISNNNPAVVVGYARYGDGSVRSWRWTGGSPTEITAPGFSNLQVRGTNDVGFYTGSAGTGASAQAVRFDGSGWQSIGSAPSSGWAINAAGAVAGYVGGGAGQRAAFWAPGSASAQTLGTLPGGVASQAYALNDANQIVGVSYVFSAATGLSPRAFYAGGPAGPMVQIAGTGFGVPSTAADINNAGIVVGFAASDAGGTHAFAWTAPGGPIVDLGKSPNPQACSSFGMGINDVCLVAGHTLINTAGAPTELARWDLNCNKPPQPTITATTAGTCSALARVDFSFTDPNGSAGGPYTYTIDWGDGTTSTGMAAAPGAYSGTHAYATNGTFNVRVTVNDGGGLSATSALAQVSRDCNSPPTPAITAKVDGSCSALPSVTFQVTDPDGAAGGPYKYSIAWGDGTTSAGDVATLGTAITVQKPAQYATQGSFTVVVTVTDGKNATGTASQQVKFECSRPPVPKITATIDGSCTAKPALKFTVSDPDGAASGPWSYTVNWGDGSPVTTGTTTTLDQEITVTKPAQFPGAGPYTVTLTVADAPGLSATVTTQAKYACGSKPPVIKYFEADCVCGKLPYVKFMISDNDNGSVGPWTYTIKWGDGTESKGTVTKELEWVAVTKPGKYPTNKKYTVTLTITDAAGREVTRTDELTYDCVDANDVPVVKYVEAQSNCSALPTVRIKVYDADGSGDAWTYSVNWGDGSAPTTGTIPGNDHMEWVTVTKPAKYSGAGPYQVVVTVKDKLGETATGKDQLTYGCAPPSNTPPAVKYVDVDLNCAKLPTLKFKVYDPNDGGPWTYTVSWGDNSANSTGSTASQMEYVTVTKPAAYGSKGPFTVKVTVTDKQGASDSETVSVTNACLKDPLTPKLVVVTANVECKANAKVTASFTDGDTGASPWTWVIEWGDGEKSTGRTSTQGNIPGDETHAYKTAGTYAVKFTVTNDEGKTASATGQITVKCGTPPSGGNACTRTQGYWKNHEEAWPKPFSPSAPFMRVGSKSVTWDQLFGMSVAGGNSYVSLAHQWMAATLNVANGVKPDAEVAGAILGASAWLFLKTGMDGSIPNLKDNQANYWAALLDEFNNGKRGTPHCD